MRPRILLLDNFDSFTWNLVDYFEQLGVAVSVKRNNVTLEEVIAEAYHGVVLSPGPGIPEDAGILMDVIQYYHRRLPMLGICLGHQALGTFFGADLVRAARPMHGKVSRAHCLPFPMFQEIPETTDVVRYHSLVLKNCPSALQVTAESLDGREIMAIQHAELPLWGFQFHPEAVLTQHGMHVLRNWLQVLLYPRTLSARAAVEKMHQI